MGWKCYVASCYKGAPTGSLLKAVCYVEYASYPPGLLADPVIKAHNGRHRGARQSSEEGCECLNYPVTLANLSSRQNAANMVSGHREAIRMSLLDPTHPVLLRLDGKIDRIRKMLSNIRPVYYLRYTGPRHLPPRETPLSKEAEASGAQKSFP
jgi:hypothetical protein